MIRLNLIDAAERESLISNVNPVHVTDVSSQVKTSKKKALTIFLSVLFVFVAFSCFLSVAGVPKPLQGALPSQYLDLIGAEDPSRSALTLSSGQTTTAGGSLEAQVAQSVPLERPRSTNPSGIVSPSCETRTVAVRLA